MESIRITRGSQRFTLKKINKNQVIKRLKDNNLVALCPCNMRLGTMWQNECILETKQIVEDAYAMSVISNNFTKYIRKEFNKTLNRFKYYNCNAETGNKVNFYSVDEIIA